MRHYKIAILIFIAASLVSFHHTYKQSNGSWTAAELKNANTAKDVAYFNDVEKEALQYINLARLYPKKFAELEIKDYTGTSIYVNYVKDSPYKQSLIAMLNSMQPVHALTPDQAMTDIADCFTKEQGKSGEKGHARKRCPKGYSAECISYGMDEGRDSAIQLLIDHKTPSLGHRKACLGIGYKVIGISFGPHKNDRYMTVLDFN